MSKYIPVGEKWIRDVWLPALRGGEYFQTVEALHTEDGGFCCLGVACDLKGVIWNKDSDQSTYYLTDDKGLSQNYVELTKEIAREIGIETNGAFTSIVDVPYMTVHEVDESGEHQTGTCSCYDLVNANDRGASFKSIAVLIERALDPADLAVEFVKPKGIDND